eukprot:1386040-Alexandrium_andersonii.AAC.1
MAVALQVADCIEADLEAAYEKEGFSTDTIPRISLRSVTLRTIHALGMALQGIVKQLKREPAAGAPGGSPASVPRGEAATADADTDTLRGALEGQ